MVEGTTTVEVNTNGRVVIPKAVREKCGFDGDRATVEITVRYDDE